MSDDNENDSLEDTDSQDFQNTPELSSDSENKKFLKEVNDLLKSQPGNNQDVDEILRSVKDPLTSLKDSVGATNLSSFGANNAIKDPLTSLKDFVGVY